MASSVLPARRSSTARCLALEASASSRLPDPGGDGRKMEPVARRTSERVATRLRERAPRSCQPSGLRRDRALPWLRAGEGQEPAACPSRRTARLRSDIPGPGGRRSCPPDCHPCGQRGARRGRAGPARTRSRASGGRGTALPNPRSSYPAGGSPRAGSVAPACAGVVRGPPRDPRRDHRALAPARTSRPPHGRVRDPRRPRRVHDPRGPG